MYQKLGLLHLSHKRQLYSSLYSIGLAVHIHRQVFCSPSCFSSCPQLSSLLLAKRQLDRFHQSNVLHGFNWKKFQRGFSGIKTDNHCVCTGINTHTHIYTTQKWAELLSFSWISPYRLYSSCSAAEDFWPESLPFGGWIPRRKKNPWTCDIYSTKHHLSHHKLCEEKFVCVSPWKEKNNTDHTLKRLKET